jgi:hypothetical protein
MRPGITLVLPVRSGGALDDGPVETSQSISGEAKSRSCHIRQPAGHVKLFPLSHHTFIRPFALSLRPISSSSHFGLIIVEMPV